MKQNPVIMSRTSIECLTYESGKDFLELKDFLVGIKKVFPKFENFFSWTIYNLDNGKTFYEEFRIHDLLITSTNHAKLWRACRPDRSYPVGEGKTLEDAVLNLYYTEIDYFEGRTHIAMRDYFKLQERLASEEKK